MVTAREKRKIILRSLADGLQTAEIAELVGLSPHTVDRHIDMMRATLKAKNRTQLVSRAHDHKLLEKRPPVVELPVNF